MVSPERWNRSATLRFEQFVTIKNRKWQPAWKGSYTEYAQCPPCWLAFSQIFWKHALPFPNCSPSSCHVPLSARWPTPSQIISKYVVLFFHNNYPWKPGLTNPLRRLQAQRIACAPFVVAPGGVRRWAAYWERGRTQREVERHSVENDHLIYYAKSRSAKQGRSKVTTS